MAELEGLAASLTRREEVLLRVMRGPLRYREGESEEREANLVAPSRRKGAAEEDNETSAWPWVLSRPFHHSFLQVSTKLQAEEPVRTLR